MKKVLFTRIGLLTLLLIPSFIIGCKEEKSSLEAKFPKMVELPSVIRDSEKANEYLAKHFWDSTELNKSSILRYSSQLEENFIIYLKQLSTNKRATIEKEIERWGKRVVETPKEVKEFLLEVTEEVLYHPNSPYREDLLYSLFLKPIMADTTLLPIVRERYKEQFKLANSNNPGELANSFVMITSKGKEIDLNSFKGRETLLLFYEPECPFCQQFFDYFNHHPKIDQIAKSINLIALYTGYNYEEWRETFTNFTHHWTVAHDKEEMITIERLYDRRPSPSIYLLDSNHRVVVKDGTLSHLQNHPLIGIPEPTSN